MAAASLNQDGTHYFDLHHTANDTPEHLRDNLRLALDLLTEAKLERRFRGERPRRNGVGDDWHRHGRFDQNPVCPLRPRRSQAHTRRTSR